MLGADEFNLEKLIGIRSNGPNSICQVAIGITRPDFIDSWRRYHKMPLTCVWLKQPQSTLHRDFLVSAKRLPKLFAELDIGFRECFDIAHFHLRPIQSMTP